VTPPEPIRRGADHCNRVRAVGGEAVVGAGALVTVVGVPGLGSGAGLCPRS
jgi:hypothetical protein